VQLERRELECEVVPEMATNEIVAPGGSAVGQAETSRVRRLRSRMLQMPEICIERACWWTKSYQETEGEAEVVRRAKALAKVLENLPIRINDDELIVGMTTSKQRGAMVFPEIQWEYIVEEADTFSSRDWDKMGVVSDEEKRVLGETLPYWRGKCTWDRFNAIMPPEIKRLHGGVFMIGTASMSGVHYGHETIDYSRVLTKGLSGIRAEVQERLSELDLADLEDFRRYEFLTAVEVALDAAAAFAERYADLARDMAAQEADGRRRAELEKIAGICERVPLQPASTFYEALQAIWLTHIVLRNEGWGPGLSFGRLDQYLYPLFKQDRTAGTLTEAEACELVGAFLAKVNDMACVTSSMNIETLAGFPTMVSMTLGGVTPEGRDAVNELSYVFLDAEEQVGLNAEEITIRVSNSNPDSFLMKAVDVSKNLHGKFKFVSDKTIINQLLSEGRPVEHARDYILAGCFTPGVPNYSLDITAAQINAPLMLELALNDGCARVTGEQVGPKTGDPRSFTSYEEVWEAFAKQVEFFMHKVVAARNIDTHLYAEFAACPFMSAFFESCVENGGDVIGGGTAPYIREGFGAGGVPNVGDSLAALKRVVFDDKLIDMKGLVDALDKNFEGEDRLLRVLKNAPKFGNDDDYVDSIVNDVVVVLAGELGKHKGLCGAKPALAVASGTGHILMGTQVGATPEGRKAGEPFAEGGISPHQGRNISGPTATLRSVAKLDHMKIRGGSVLNMKFNPDALAGADKKEKFLSMLRMYCETGGFHVQFNIVDAKTLRDAQKHPEQYRDMLVRVATYSAKFVELSPRMQEDIIARTEFQ
jgi:pyruvate formate-lyase/glycerol dehydratase family glycyl radical enzyme